MGNSYLWVAGLFAPIFAIGVIKLAAWISGKLPKGRLKKLLLYKLWSDDAPGRR